MTNKELYDLTRYLFESWERGADYDNYHMDCQYVLDALVMPEEERWLLYKSPAQRKPLTDERIREIWIEHGSDGDDAEGFARAIEAELKENT